MTAHQRKILNYALANGNQVSKKQACTMIRFYCNTEKHVGDILSRMVKSGLLIRIKPGLFKIGNGKRVAETTQINNQIDLF